MTLRYSDKEVESFHPVCQQSLQTALRILGKAERYRVEHHKRAGELEMDFAITNKTSGRIACVVEVKRTPAAVLSIPGNVLPATNSACTDRTSLLHPD